MSPGKFPCVSVTSHYGQLLRECRRSRRLQPSKLIMGSHGHFGYELTMYQIKMKAKLVTDYERRRARDKLRYDEAVCDDGALTVELTDVYARDNAAAHHTDRFLIVADPAGGPVLRRGLPFYLAVRFCRPLDISVDTVRFVFELGPRPEVTSGTRHVISVTSRPELAVDKSSWDVRVHRQDSCITIFQVRIPVKCPVGIWRCKIQTSKVKTSRLDTKEFIVNEDIYILFNPWSQDDGVYLASPEARQEFVSSDCGRVWKGTYRQPRGRHWVFGQYDDVVLPVTMLLLEKSNLDHSRRGSPVDVARAICSVVRADGEAEVPNIIRGGINPSAFTGSVAILEKYLKEEENPVRCDQSWVSSAVAIAVFRALGIPTRPVTAFVSGHGSLTIARYFRAEGEWLDPPRGGRSPPWSFHVWVEGWMARPDLPEGHGGWQVLDPTPHHAASGMSACGPTSVAAVRRGEVGFVYDTAVVYAAVNGDLVHLREDLDADHVFSEQRPHHYRVGCTIVTDSLKMDSDREDCFDDITKNYKNEEGTTGERLAVINAILGFPPPPKIYRMERREKNEEVLFELVDIENIMFGQPFSTTVRVQNKSHREHDICVTLSAYSVLPTGEKAHHICRKKNSFVLQPNQRENLVLSVVPKEYVDKLADHSLIKIFAFAVVKDSRQKWSEEDDFQMIKPKLTMEVKGFPKVGQECSVVFSFQNPLDVVLTHCIFCVEGPGLSRPKTQRHRDVMPNELVTITESFAPKMVGKRKMNASFTSRQLTEVVGSSCLEVAE